MVVARLCWIGHVVKLSISQTWSSICGFTSYQTYLYREYHIEIIITMIIVYRIHKNNDETAIQIPVNTYFITYRILHISTKLTKSSASLMSIWSVDRKWYKVARAVTEVKITFVYINFTKWYVNENGHNSHCRMLFIII